MELPEPSRCFGKWNAKNAHALLEAFLGTFAPFFRASDKPIAIACFLLFTRPPFPPLPDRSVPVFFRCKALLTDFFEALPYFAISPPFIHKH